jgi:hypothetical protein
MGNRDGEEGFEASAVDEGRRSDAGGARARENRDDFDCAETQAHSGSDVSAGIKAGRDVGRRSRKERGVMGAVGQMPTSHHGGCRSVGSRACPACPKPWSWSQSRPTTVLLGLISRRDKSPTSTSSEGALCASQQLNSRFDWRSCVECMGGSLEPLGTVERGRTDPSYSPPGMLPGETPRSCPGCRRQGLL